MRKLLAIIAIYLFSGTLLAQSNVKVFNLSLWNPVATVPYEYDNANLLSVGLLQSKVNNSYGLNVNLLSGITTGRMYGLQISGLHSVIEGASQGVSFAGLYNIHKASMSGVAISGLANMNLVNGRGVQLSAVQNICMFNTDGLQISLLMNVTGQELSGVQVAAGFNVASVSKGVQLAGLVNFSLDHSSGVQLAAINYATSMQGVQLGVANFARRIKGVQVGIINYSADSSTVKIGLVSISPHSKIRPIVYYSNLATFNVGVRFMNRISYSILGLGTPYDAPRSTSSGVFFYRLGLYHTLGRVTFSSDVGASYISKFIEEIDHKALSMEARFNFEVLLNNHISLLCSGGYSVSRFLSRKASAQLKPIVEFGLILPNLLKYK